MTTTAKKSGVSLGCRASADNISKMNSSENREDFERVSFFSFFFIRHMIKSRISAVLKNVDSHGKKPTNSNNVNTTQHRLEHFPIISSLRIVQLTSLHQV